MTPTQLPRRRRGHRDPLRHRRVLAGSILVAASERGVCAILLGDDPDALARDLQDRFPRAQLIGGDAGVRAAGRAGGRLRRGARASGLDLPLDVRGTAFQQRVWQALRDDPAGHDRELRRDRRSASARRRPVRAVAQACAANALAVAIPCHRVVRSDGALSGYRWGVERKRALLEREAQRMSARDAGRGARRAASTRSPARDRGARLGRASPPTSTRRAARCIARPARRRAECAALAALYARRRPLPQPRRDGAARLRARRVQVLRLPAARRSSPSCATALYPPLAPIANRWNAAMGHRRALSRPRTPSSSRAATRPGRRGRRRCCCSTARATTTACTRTSTASTSSRCRSRSCCPSRGATSPAASSC